MTKQFNLFVLCYILTNLFLDQFQTIIQIKNILLLTSAVLKQRKNIFLPIVKKQLPITNSPQFTKTVCSKQIFAEIKPIIRSSQQVIDVIRSQDTLRVLPGPRFVAHWRRLWRSSVDVAAWKGYPPFMLCAFCMNRNTNVLCFSGVPFLWKECLDFFGLCLCLLTWNRFFQLLVKVFLPSHVITYSKSYIQSVLYYSCKKLQVLVFAVTRLVFNMKPFHCVSVSHNFHTGVCIFLCPIRENSMVTNWTKLQLHNVYIHYYVYVINYVWNVWHRSIVLCQLIWRR